MKTYRLKRSYLWLSVIALLLCLVALVGSITFGIDDAPRQRRWLLIGMFAIAWGGMSCLQFWLLALYLRQRLQFDNLVVREIGLFSHVELSFAEIVDAQWSDLPNAGRLRLTTTGKKLSIHFQNYEPVDRRDIIRHFRGTLPREVQRGWDRFCHVVLIGVDPNREPRPGQDVVVRERRRMDVMFALGLVVAIPVCMVAWHMTDDPRSLIAIPGFSGFWLCLRWFVPAKATVDRSPQLTSPALRKLNRSLMAWAIAGLTLPCALLVLCVLGARDSHVAYAAIAAIAGMFVWVCVFQRFANRIDRERRRLSEPLEHAAAAEWELAEAALAQSGAAGESP